MCVCVYIYKVGSDEARRDRGGIEKREREKERPEAVEGKANKEVKKGMTMDWVKVGRERLQSESFSG